MSKSATPWILVALILGAQLLCQAEASRGVGQQAKPTAKREQAVAGTTAAISPRAAVAPTATAARNTHAAGPDPSSYSSVMAGTSYSKLGRFFMDPNQEQSTGSSRAAPPAVPAAQPAAARP
uniref:Uncharacterized protein n=1 Tax=Tetradesmus obliquus TaxID=3088 RepID=A0A383WJB1_TETOB|eukprot:jgi/Sobl393_1/10876/SZX77550.1